MSRLPSMGRVGDADDNGIVGAFILLLTGELVDRQIWPTRAAARLAIVADVECS